MISIKRFKNGESDEDINLFAREHFLVSNGFQVHPTTGEPYILYDDGEPFDDQARKAALKMSLVEFKNKHLQKEIECQFYADLMAAKPSNESVIEGRNKAEREKETYEAQIAIVEEMLKEAPKEKEKNPKVFGKRKYNGK